MVARCTWAAVILFGVAAFGAPPAARAFERSTVDGDPDKPLFWRYRWVTIRPAYDTCADVSAAPVELAIARSIGSWNGAAETCSNFALFDGGPPSGTRTNLDGGEPDMENRVVWRQQGEWPEDEETLALTTIVYRRASGQIVDADIDLNGDYGHFWTDTIEPGLVNVDVENTMAHELGHLLGLAHVLETEATMYGISSSGELDKRSLEADDVAGLCFVYPRGAPTPGAPDFDPQPLTGGCAAARGGLRSSWIVLALSLALARGARRARRGAPRRETAS